MEAIRVEFTVGQSDRSLLLGAEDPTVEDEHQAVIPGTVWRDPVHDEEPAAGVVDAHSHLPWCPTHPRYVLVREDELMEPLANFFDLRVFGASRKILLGAAAQEQIADNTIATRKARLAAEIMELQQRQGNLITELGKFTQTGDADFDDAWRSGIQAQFAGVVAEQRSKKLLLADLVREEQASAPVDLDLLDYLPQGRIDLNRLPEDQQRRIYDAFHLELRYNALNREVSIRVSITGETAPILAATIESVIGEHSEARNPGSEAQATDPGVAQPAEQRVLRQIPDGKVVADALRAPGRAHRASATISDLRRRSPVEIEYRYVLPSK